MSIRQHLSLVMTGDINTRTRVLLSTHSVSLEGWRAGCWRASVPAKLLPMGKSRAHPCTLQDTGCPLYSRLRLCSGSIFPDTYTRLVLFLCIFKKIFFRYTCNAL